MTDRPDLKIGDTIWLFSVNRRVYAPNSRSGPIYREHWYPVKITGETRASWLLETHGKVPKKREGLYQYATSLKEVEDDVWDHDHRHKIVERIRYSKDIPVAILHQIATLIGYEEAKE